MKIRYLIVSLLLPAVAFAQEYSITLIPAELLRKANMIVRQSSTDIEVKNAGRAIITHRFAYTIMNAAGEQHASIVLYYDKFQSIRSFHGTLYSGAGEKIKSTKKSDILDLTGSSSDGLADDNRMKSHDFNYQVYPYTIAYETSVELDGIFYFPPWTPVEDEHVSVTESVLRVKAPLDYNLRYKAFNFEKEPAIQMVKESRYFEWKVANHAALVHEDYSLPWYETTPAVFLAPTSFELDSYKGSMAEWLGFGKFIQALNTGRDVLPPAIKAKVHELSDGLTPAEKIKILYSFMQQNTRYISIQLGIGGWQPFDANYVSAKGYGDCKALSNYMYSLLKEAGIKSHYTLIKAGYYNQSFLADFPSNQFNHVILCVPQGKDTTWLECTSQTATAGYLGSFTSNRHALLIDETGGILVKTPHYTKADNLQARKVRAVVDNEGHLLLHIDTRYHAEQQDHVDGLLNALSKESIKRYLKDKLSIPSYDVIKYGYTQGKGSLPSINEKLEVMAYNFATVSGKRMFITPNILNRSGIRITQSQKRISPVKLVMEYTDTDSIEINVPEGYSAESIPANVSLSTPFGKYSTTHIFEPGKILYIRSMEMNSGNYPAADASAFTDFYDKIYKADRSRIVLVKKE